MTALGDVVSRDSGDPPERTTSHVVSPAARIALIACYLACLTIPWTAIKVGTLRVGDIFLLVALALLFAADFNLRARSLPAWVWFFIVTIVAVGVTREFFPTPASYLAARESVDGIRVVHGVILNSSNVSVLIRFLIPVVGLPLIFIRAHHFDRRALERSAIAFTIGSAVSAVAAFTDVEGLTGISPALTGIGIGATRGAGLTEDANYVAMACVFSLPFVLWQLASSNRRTRVWAAAGLVAILLGFYASGSRSGAGAGLVALGLSFAIIPRYRKALPMVGFVLTTVAVALFIVVPSVGYSLLTQLRFTGTEAAGSNSARDVVNDQALRDFNHSPLAGVGLQVAGEAHIVYYQALAAGGIILFSGYVIFLLSAMVRCLRLVNVNSLAAPLFVSILAGAIFNAAQNALTLRIVFVPAALAAALPLVRAAAGPRAVAIRTRP